MHANRLRLLLVGALVMILASGCATLSEEACLRGNWYGIGYEDGMRGKAEIQLVLHRKACAEYGVVADESDYLTGREQGLRFYCQESKGYSEAKALKDYTGSCPPRLEQDFLRGYLQGLEAAENDLHRKISQKSRALTASALLVHELKGEERKEELAEIEQLQHDLDNLEDKFSTINNLRRKYGVLLK